MSATHIQEEESITQKVQKVTDQKELAQRRRAGDQLDAWIKILVPIALSGVIVVLSGVIFWLLSIRDTQNEHKIYITQTQQNIEAIRIEIRELQKNRDLDKFVDAVLADMAKRMDKLETKLDQRGGR
jgi:hypothetical protein